MITTCIGSNNNLPYLKLAIESIKKNHHFKDTKIIVAAENCTDGTNEWLEENKERLNIQPIIIDCPDDTCGIGYGMNEMAKVVETEFIHFLHADMYVAPDQDLALLKLFDKYPNEKLVVTSHRVEPNVFVGTSSRPGVIITPNNEFGAFHHDFRQDVFDEWATEFTKENEEYEIPLAWGCSFMIRKSDWDESGGNDPQYNPAAFEDHDLFLTMRHKGFKFVLTGSSMVYHFASRSFNSNFPNDVMTRSNRLLAFENRNAGLFIKKWGGLPMFDEYGMICGVRPIST
jgi:GT2 family glycosyltransferase